MIITTAAELDKLLNELTKKGHHEDFVFRGHADSKWLLQPKAFRPPEIEKSWKTYKLSKDEALKNWIEHDETFARLNLYLDKRLNLTKFNYKGLKIIHKKRLIPLHRILWHHIDIMKYNYNLRMYASLNESYYSAEYRKSITDTGRLVDSWVSYETFLFLLQQISYMPDCTALFTDELLNEPVIFEGLASVDETRAQHYGIATSALDWTCDPVKALYFAAHELIERDLSTSIIIAPALNFSLYAYKQLKEGDEVSVKLGLPDSQIANDRAVKQQGRFTYLSKANSFCLLNDRYPRIEDYRHLEGKEFLLEKYDVQLNTDTIEYIQNKLNELDINQITLGLRDNVCLELQQ